VGSDDERTELEDAVEFLREALDDGSRQPALDVIREAG